MTQADTRSIGYGVAASVAVHLLLFAGMGIWMSSTAFQRRFTSRPAPVEEPGVTLVFAEAIETVETPAPPPTPKKPEERYIRTTQNEASGSAPEKADFVSDRNTTAAAKRAPVSAPDSDPAMPATEGVGFMTRELANRDYKDGETKEDSAPSPPVVDRRPEPPVLAVPQPPAIPAPPPAAATPPPDKPMLRSPDPVSPPPKTEIVKKTDSPMEEMMQELDQEIAASAAAQNPPLEIRRALPATEAPPAEPPPTDAAPTADMPPSPPVPRAIPMPDPIANTPNPQEEAFQPHTRTATVKGTISNRGAMDSVNAASTPTGRYMRQVTSAIEKKWHTLRSQNQDFVEPGKLRIQFYVNKNGKTEDITILSNQANPVMTDFSLTAILKAELPPIPKDLLLILEKERVEIEYDIVIY